MIASRRAFTLIEILVVVMITGIVTAVAMPNFIRAMRGAALRTSTRTVVMACKYARSMAVLDQKERVVLFDRVENTVEIISLASEGGVDREGFLDARSMPADTPGSEGAQTNQASPYKVEKNIVRSLGNDVKILGFESKRDDQVIKDIYWVSFYSSGMNDGFTLRLEDSYGKQATIKLDSISGTVKVDFSR